jgi:lipopolysaccharide transport system ATP-binding protein
MNRQTAAISVNHLAKRYRVNRPSFVGRDDLRETLARRLTAPLHWLRHGAPRAADQREFWALRDASFEVRPGEVLGVVGRNGAGKSTLLKILARVTEPTAGRARLRGRVGSLLEIGTGFHPDLSGRENIFMGGAILGMPRAEIKRRFDAIVDFAGVEAFLDAPVKRYSSGLRVRLGFAVAAHLDPEILLVDEVLAVGDAAFQQKCLGTMRDAAGGGRTVLFVSHNLAAVAELCTRCLALAGGRIIDDGEPRRIVADYLESSGPHGRQVE